MDNTTEENALRAGAFVALAVENCKTDTRGKARHRRSEGGGGPCVRAPGQEGELLGGDRKRELTRGLVVLNDPGKPNHAGRKGYSSDNAGPELVENAAK